MTISGQPDPDEYDEADIDLRSPDLSDVGIIQDQPKPAPAQSDPAPINQDQISEDQPASVLQFVPIPNYGQEKQRAHNAQSEDWLPMR